MCYTDDSDLRELIIEELRDHYNQVATPDSAWVEAGHLADWCLDRLYHTLDDATDIVVVANGLVKMGIIESQNNETEYRYIPVDEDEDE